MTRERCAICNGVGLHLNPYDLDGPYVPCDACNGQGSIAIGVESEPEPDVLDRVAVLTAGY